MAAVVTGMLISTTMTTTSVPAAAATPSERTQRQQGGSPPGTLPTIDSVLTGRMNNLTGTLPVSDCGIHYYYHVPKTGGNSVLEWQRLLAKLNPSRVEFVQFYRQLSRTAPDWHTEGYRLTSARIEKLLASVSSNDEERRGDIIRERGSSEREYGADLDWRYTFVHIEQRVDSGRLSDKKQWLTIHHHHWTPGLRFLMPHLRKWKKDLEAQGCSVLLTANIRETVSRAKSFISYYDIPKSGLPTLLQQYSGQARYLLYGTCEARDDGNSPEWCAGEYWTGHSLTDSELGELFGYLLEFDVISPTEHLEDFLNTVEKLTGWKDLVHPQPKSQGRAPNKNKSNAKYEITDDMVEMLRPALDADDRLWRRTFGDDHHATQNRI